MSLTIEIIENIFNLEIETAISDSINNLDIEASSNQIIEISTDYMGNVIVPTDIIGLDTYLSNFIDNYEIDCGSP